MVWKLGKLQNVRNELIQTAMHESFEILIINISARSRLSDSASIGWLFEYWMVVLLCQKFIVLTVPKVA
jgi:hypothetical protein